MTNAQKFTPYDQGAIWLSHAYTHVTCYGYPEVVHRQCANTFFTALLHILFDSLKNDR